MPNNTKRRPTEEFYNLGYNAVWSVKSQPTFQRKISTLSSGLKNISSMKPARSRCFMLGLFFSSACYLLMSCLSYSSTLKIDMACSSETSVTRISQKMRLLYDMHVRTSDPVYRPTAYSHYALSMFLAMCARSPTRQSINSFPHASPSARIKCISVWYLIFNCRKCGKIQVS
jgi:hypothetical protein